MEQKIEKIDSKEALARNGRDISFYIHAIEARLMDLDQFNKKGDSYLFQCVQCCVDISNYFYSISELNKKVKEIDEVMFIVVIRNVQNHGYIELLGSSQFSSVLIGGNSLFGLMVEGNQMINRNKVKLLLSEIRELTIDQREKIEKICVGDCFIYKNIFESALVKVKEIIENVDYGDFKGILSVKELCSPEKRYVNLTRNNKIV
jgi:hypothetical protein